MKLVLRLTLVLAIALAAFSIAVWYDESPDAQMQGQWENRAPVPDENNLFLALLGADIASREPLHVTGRRLFESASAEDFTRLTVSDSNRRFFDMLRAACHPVADSAGESCLRLRLHLSLGATQSSEQRLADGYRALRRYTGYRSELRSDGRLMAGQLIKTHEAFLATQLAVDQATAIPVERLAADTRFLRDALSLGDSLLARIIGAATLERDYRLVEEVIATGNASQIAMLRDVLAPLPEQALDMRRDIPALYAEIRLSGPLLRKALSRGEDPLQDIAKMMDRPSPFAGPAWQRRVKALWLKPEMNANASLSRARAEFGIVHSQPENPLRQILDATVNATGSEIRSFSGSDGAWTAYRDRLSDLDRYIRLIVVVAALVEQKAFNPARVVADWNGKLPPDAQAYRLNWDERRYAFSFNPQSAAWKSRADDAGHGVLVRVPKYIADGRRGSARRL